MARPLLSFLAFSTTPTPRRRRRRRPSVSLLRFKPARRRPLALFWLSLAAPPLSHQRPCRALFDGSTVKTSWLSLVVSNLRAETRLHMFLGAKRRGGRGACLPGRRAKSRYIPSSRPQHWASFLSLISCAHHLSFSCLLGSAVVLSPLRFFTPAGRWYIFCFCFHQEH